MTNSVNRNYHRHVGHRKNPNRIRNQERWNKQIQLIFINKNQMTDSVNKNNHRRVNHKKNPNRIRGQEKENKQVQPTLIKNQIEGEIRMRRRQTEVQVRLRTKAD